MSRGVGVLSAIGRLPARPNRAGPKKLLCLASAVRGYCQTPAAKVNQKLVEFFTKFPAGPGRREKSFPSRGKRPPSAPRPGGRPQRSSGVPAGQEFTVDTPAENDYTARCESAKATSPLADTGLSLRTQTVLTSSCFLSPTRKRGIRIK